MANVLRPILRPILRDIAYPQESYFPYGNSPTNPTAFSIYQKLTDGEWFVMDSAGSSITGAHNGKVANKIGTGSTQVVSGGVDFTPNALYRLATADLPFTPAANGKVTICGWVKADSIDNVSPFLLGDGTTSTAASRTLHAFFIYPGLAKGRAGTGGSFADADTPTSAVTTGTTYFLQVQRLSNKVRVRIDNGTWYETATTADSAPTSNQVFSMGGDYYTSSPADTYGNSFDGVLRDVLIHSSASGTLTDAELDYLYNGGAGVSYAQLKTNAGF